MQRKILHSIDFSELAVGQTASVSRILTRKDIDLFAAVSGDVNPAHMDETYAKTDIFHGIVGHGMWLGALISNVLGTVLPGPGTIYLEQDIRFKKPVRIGDKITAQVTVQSKRADKPIVTLDCRCVNEKNEIVAEGKAVVLAPVSKIDIESRELPIVEIKGHLPDHFESLIKTCHVTETIKTAVVHPVTPHVLIAVAEAVREKLIKPILIGPEARIKGAAGEAKIDISSWELINTEHSHAAAEKAADMAAQGQVGIIMKGALHTDELLKSIVRPDSRLHTERRITHAAVMDIPNYHKPLIITDAAINIAPDLEIKADICRNAIDLWRILNGDGKKPKVAILAAIETVNSRMQATIDAACLCKMADRGQIKNGILDGPLALDVAISKESAREKGIQSVVVGDADILIAPEIEAGNMLLKQLTFMGGADMAGIVLGARVPIILTSRSDSERSRLLSCSLAVKLAIARKDGVIK